MITAHPLISVIVPVYNVEAYLRRCVDSICGQTYDNLEIILVDDGSTDQSGAICDFYAKEDLRVHVIHKSNGGLSSARNTGLRVCQGEFLMFVDSDDFITPHCVEILHQSLLKYEADIAVGRSVSTRENQIKEQPCRNIKIWDQETALRYLLYQKNYTVSAWGKLYRTKLWDGIIFPDGILFEDTATIPWVIAKAGQLVWCDALLYGYYTRPGSITKSGFNPRIMDYERNCAELKEKIIAIYPSLKKAAVSRYVWANLFIWTKMPTELQDENKQRVETNIRRYRRAVLTDPEVRFRNKLVLLLSYMGQASVQMVYKIAGGSRIV